MPDNIDVFPSQEGSAVPVATEVIGGVHYPSFKPYHDGIGGEARAVGYEDPLPVLPSSHMYSKGNIEGHETLRKFGENPSVPTSSRFIEAGVTTETQPWMPTSAIAVRVRAGGNAADTNGGAGAQTIIVEGLDESFNRASETITLAGASASSATTTTFIRVFRAYVVTCGTYGAANTGIVTIETTGGTRILEISANDGQSNCMHYCVPAAMKLFIKDFHVTAESAKSTTVTLWQRQNASDVVTPFSPVRIIRRYRGLAGAADLEYTPEIYIPEKTDIYATGYVSAATGAVAVELNCILETL